MRRSHWTVKVLKGLLAAASGSTLLAGSCAADVRDNIVAGGLTFVKSYTVEVLETLVPSWTDLMGDGGAQQ